MLLSEPDCFCLLTLGSLASTFIPSGNASSDMPSSSTLRPASRQIPHHSRMIASLLRLHASHFHVRLSLASLILTSLLASNPPIWPDVPGSAMNDRKAVNAVRTPQAGIHVSSWNPEMLRQISRLTSNRPDAVRKRKLGGLSGYVVGSVMRPWKIPPA